MKEIKKIISDYEKYAQTSKYSQNSLYEYKSNRKLQGEIWEDYAKLVSYLELVQNVISRNKEMLIIYDKSHTWTKYYYKSSKWYRLLGNNTKNIKIDSLILNMQALNHRSLFFEFMRNIHTIFWTKYFYFIKFDLKKYYINIKLKHIIKAIKYFIKKTYGKITNKWEEIIILLKKYQYAIFWTTWLYLWNYIWKLISYILWAFIIFHQKAKVKIFFEDDFLLLYKKDKRLNLKKKFNEIVHFLDKLWFELNLNKTNMWRLFYDDLTFLWYSFGKRKRIFLGEDVLLLRKYRFVRLIEENIKIQWNRITKLKFIKRKIKYWLGWFYNYYKFANNIDIVMKNICKFVRKLIRYIVWKKTELNLFDINTYLSNKQLLFNKCS